MFLTLQEFTIDIRVLFGLKTNGAAMPTSVAVFGVIQDRVSCFRSINSE